MACGNASALCSTSSPQTNAPTISAPQAMATHSASIMGGDVATAADVRDQVTTMLRHVSPGKPWARLAGKCEHAAAQCRWRLASQYNQLNSELFRCGPFLSR